MYRVAVTGLGVVSPVGNDVASFWESLKAGRHGIAPVTHFDTSDQKAKLAAEVKGFNALDYMEKAETRRSDVYTQFAMGAACQAMADSGLAGHVAPERFGVYFGSGIGGIATFSSEYEKLMNIGPKRISPYFIPMMIANIAAGCIAIRFGAKGPCVPVVTACATSSTAIGEALRCIRHGYADAVIAGGAEAAVVPISLAGFTNMQALSLSQDPDAASLPFDKRRAGFVMGEGAGALVLERYDLAQARGAKIYAELAGYGSTCDAYHMTAPDPEATGAARAIADAWQEAGGGTEGIYINAHGTGTPLNDLAETKAIHLALGETAKTCAVSSTKSMTGHMLGAAGAIEAAACVLAIRDGIVPPTINLLEPDEGCDLDYVPNTARHMDVRLALSTSLGFGGHNACLAFKKEA